MTLRQCAPGQEPEAAGQGLNPKPPDLAESAARMTPAELFWVTKNGIKMTGMPAWGATHDDASIWPVVAFLTALPSLDEAAYRTMLDSAKGAGHHTADGGNEAGSHSHSDESAHGAGPDHGGAADHGHQESTQAEPVKDTEAEHDHGTHDH